MPHGTMTRKSRKHGVLFGFCCRRGPYPGMMGVGVDVMTTTRGLSLVVVGVLDVRRRIYHEDIPTHQSPPWQVLEVLQVLQVLEVYHFGHFLQRDYKTPPSQRLRHH